ncbi:MAG: hypothetical protein IK068_03895 [Lachnospiraceae bacterium]|nr:hypothetical protein [Lachnospiraceae bacterium]
MAQTDWVYSIESKIYTIVKTRLENSLKTSYPNLLVTQQSKTSDEPKFPTVYIQMLDSPEMGADLENSTINALLTTFEVHVIASKEQGLAGLRKVQSAVTENFKKLRFNVVTRGEFTRETNDTYTSISRFRRVIGGEEEINF